VVLCEKEVFVTKAIKRLCFANRVSTAINLIAGFALLAVLAVLAYVHFQTIVQMSAVLLVILAAYKVLFTGRIRGKRKK
jgi:hypothetical protein